MSFTSLTSQCRTFCSLKSIPSLPPSRVGKHWKLNAFRFLVACNYLNEFGRASIPAMHFFHQLEERERERKREIFFFFSPPWGWWAFASWVVARWNQCRLPSLSPRLLTDQPLHMVPSSLSLSLVRKRFFRETKSRRGRCCLENGRRSSSWLWLGSRLSWPLLLYLHLDLFYPR